MTYNKYKIYRTKLYETLQQSTTNHHSRNVAATGKSTDKRKENQLEPENQHNQLFYTSTGKIFVVFVFYPKNSYSLLCLET